MCPHTPRRATSPPPCFSRSCTRRNLDSAVPGIKPHLAKDRGHGLLRGVVSFLPGLWLIQVLPSTTCCTPCGHCDFPCRSRLPVHDAPLPFRPLGGNRRIRTARRARRLGPVSRFSEWTAAIGLVGTWSFVRWTGATEFTGRCWPAVGMDIFGHGTDTTPGPPTTRHHRFPTMTNAVAIAVHKLPFGYGTAPPFSVTSASRSPPPNVSPPGPQRAGKSPAAPPQALLPEPLPPPSSQPPPPISVDGLSATPNTLQKSDGESEYFSRIRRTSCSEPPLAATFPFGALHLDLDADEIQARVTGTDRRQT
ncbi:MAG: hypothetical protein CM1200mP2_59770 [Planctomycetaceae bacterium]|nr:MAG: hypothetical protein CM1200mP2_59770 [Planctomycetaceae bacterium]